MIKVTVLLTAFGEPNESREVAIPMEPEAWAILRLAAKLDQVFHYGQNDVQPMKRYSVSCGDVILLDDTYYLICGIGFKRLSLIEYQEYIKMPQQARSLHVLKQKGGIE